MSEWRPVKGWEGLYEVSNGGHVRKVNGAPVGQWRNHDGYLVVRFSQPRAMARVHRLVAEAFVPNPHGKPNINHLDCIRDHNDAENLEWCTQAENIKHSQRLGRIRFDLRWGQRPAHAKLTSDQIRDIRNRYQAGGISFSALAAEFDISKRTVGRLIHKEYYANV